MTTEQQRLAAIIDHTLLKPEAQPNHIANLCAEARAYSFASVCVNPNYVALAAERLAGSAVNVCTVIGFPLGANATETKVFETELAIKHGAREVDMVISIGALKSGNYALVEHDIKAVADTARSNGALCKVIVETCLLSEEEKITVCGMVTRAGADFIKTSTGFSTGGATLADVRLMRQHIGTNVQIKASGGVRDIQFAMQLIEAGATRLGTSSGVALVQAMVDASVTIASGY
jgi:deoxyribose-phosphate aldolase